MSSNKPFAVPSSCGCGGGPDKAPLSGSGRPDQLMYYIQSDPSAFTSTCGNVGHSPIECTDCCEGVAVIPPYVPAPADMAVTPVCPVIS